MTKKISWRLGRLPDSNELVNLVLNKIITQDEAREILFSKEDIDERDKKSLESEIKFLRELVEQLSKNNTKTITETIRYIEKPYYHQTWYQPYNNWALCTSTNATAGVGGTYSTLTGTTSLANTTGLAQGTSNSFSKIKTF